MPNSVCNPVLQGGYISKEIKEAFVDPGTGLNEFVVCGVYQTWEQAKEGCCGQASVVQKAIIRFGDDGYSYAGHDYDQERHF